MTRHSKTFAKRKQELEEREQKLRQELDLDSEIAEKKAADFMKTTAVVLVGLGVGYWIYRSVKSSERVTDDPPQKEQGTTASVKKSVINSLSQQLAGIATKVLISFIQSLIEKKESKEATKGS